MFQVAVTTQYIAAMTDNLTTETGTQVVTTLSREAQTHTK
jgi:hypothetical protein